VKNTDQPEHEGFTVRAAKRKRELPRTVCATIPQGVVLEDLARRVTYVGSPEHKSYPSHFGAPRLRVVETSKCDPSFKDRVQEIEGCLRSAIRDGKVGGPWEYGFPRYAWGILNGQWYEARLTNSANGEYKGYPLRPDQTPKGA
jgi:hypothetical protein